LPFPSSSSTRYTLPFMCSTPTLRREIHTAVVTSREKFGLGNEFRVFFVVFCCSLGLCFIWNVCV
jgi:hypothetical protein